ncbi:ROK family protein [Plantactinospora sp. KBS50]|uniref:ROK family protein n=1 Tax=Plantactinospora sp. KBS50 TaxID=2024580 RepID=UPI000BAAA605|nr:ROK family protein [Plantactinospora sp. KBS50]ASW56392.1 sugar kinase [Plantactinospora sp. KBS50]
MPAPAPRGPVGTGTPIRQSGLRAHNLALVLDRIAHAARPPSRADLAATTGLTRATVSALADELLRGRLVAEVEPARRSGAGRPAAGLVLAGHAAGLGLEINVDYLAACVIDLTGRVRHREVRRQDLRPVSPGVALDRLADLAASAGDAARAAGLALAGTTLAVPGLVDPAGMVRRAPNLDWHDVDVPGMLADRIAGLAVENEANLAALGELHAGTAPNSFLYVSGEIGVGAGVILSGALYRGSRGFGGELGHLPVDPGGRPCRCGSRGCLEQYAGQEAILAAAGGIGERPAARGRSGTGEQRAAGGNSGRSAGGGIGERPAGGGAGQPAAPLHRVAELARAGDDAALAALDRAGRALGVAVAGAVNLLDLGTVLLGGGYAELAPWLLPALRAELSRRVVTAGWAPLEVRAALLGPDAAVIGAAGSVIRSVLAQPAHWLTRAA